MSDELLHRVEQLLAGVRAYDASDFARYDAVLRDVRDCLRALAEETTLLCMRDGCRMHAVYCAEHAAPQVDPPYVAMQQRIRRDMLIERLIDSLVWCSGSQDFAPGGQARVGWERGPQKVLEEARTYLARSPQ